MEGLVQQKQKDIKDIHIRITIDNKLTYKCGLTKTSSRVTYTIYCEQTNVRRKIVIQNYPKANFYNLTAYKNLIQEVICIAPLDAKILNIDIDEYNYADTIIQNNIE